ncbi:hypothetical protein [Streptomyces bicolor]|uniref:hypothetical protein n=1 Tax=Streptomyces bicolor TaxID=66874 RepID=UPI0004E189BD|nr:hypothetical protein [Streptomyces bicolor]
MDFQVRAPSSLCGLDITGSWEKSFSSIWVTASSRSAFGLMPATPSMAEYNTQINYQYGDRTWTDRSGAPPLISIVGEVESPCRELSALEERDAPFFFDRDDAVRSVAERMARCVTTGGLLMVSGVSGAGMRKCDRSSPGHLAPHMGARTDPGRYRSRAVSVSPWAPLRQLLCASPRAEAGH